MIGTINQALSLNQVNQQFDQFRSERKKQTKFPDTLWQQAITLLEHHSMTEVSRALRVSAQQIKAQMHKNRSKNGVQMDFVEVKQSAEKCESFNIKPQEDDALKTKVEIKRPDGAYLIINQLPEAALSQLLTHFMGGLA
tara:strand:+ start:83 stop:499 length:417 start_codon:yes stop_codon:yes gene_type:complete